MDVTVSEQATIQRTSAGSTRCVVWWATSRRDARLLDLLSPGERQRAHHLGPTAGHDRFVTARALLRVVLARTQGRASEALEIDTSCHRCGGSHGKPRLVEPAVPVVFSLSYAGERVVVALSDGAPVGVDVEAIDEVSEARAAAMATGLLTAVERDAWRALPPSERAHALAVWWTRKEAVLKATGEGLAIPPSHLSVTGPPAAPALIAWGRDLRWSHGVAPVVRLHDLSNHAFAASLAVLTARSLSVTEHDGDEVLERWRAGR